MKVVFSSDAINDLDDIGFLIWQDSPKHADAFVAELRKRCLGLADFPRRFPAVKRIGDRDIRKLSWRGYAVF
jgi:plasmid stabilization system protein ParE